MKKTTYRGLLILESIFIILIGITCYGFAHNTGQVGSVKIVTDKTVIGNNLCVTVKEIRFFIADGKPEKNVNEYHIKKEIVPELTASDVNDNQYAREWFSGIKEGDYYVGEE